MKRKSRKQGLLIILLSLLALSWVGTVSGFPGASGLLQGFQADEKGYPGWCQNDQHRIPGQQNGKQSDEAAELFTIGTPVNPGYNGGPNGEGGRGGHHPPMN